MKKLIEHTNGTHIYMKIQFDDGRTEEIDVYIRADGEHYIISADQREEPGRREEIIKAFNDLY